MDNISNPGDSNDNAKKDPFNRQKPSESDKPRVENNGSEKQPVDSGCNITINKRDIEDAVEEGLIIKEFAPQLWNFFSGRAQNKFQNASSAKDQGYSPAQNFNSQSGADRTDFRPPLSNYGAQENQGAKKSRFTVENVIYFFGGLMIIAAMTFFIGVAFEQLGGPGITLVSALYITAFVVAGRSLYFDQGYEVPGGLLITVAVCIVPLLIYGLEATFNFWPKEKPSSYHEFHIWVKASWIFMEVGTIAAGALALKFFKFPFITMPISVSAWYLSMDLTPLLLGMHFENWENRLLVSCLSGIIIILTAYNYDRRTEKDYSFWLYLFGVIAFWCSLSFMDGGGGEFNKFIYCIINVIMIFISVIIQRKVFIVFGGLGVFGYLGYLSSSVFRDFIGFTFALTLLGLAMIGIGIFYSKNREYFNSIPDRIPESFKPYLPQYRDGRK